MEFFRLADDLVPCGMFTVGHFLLFTMTIACVTLALKLSKHQTKTKTKKTIKIVTIFLWILEIIKIVLSINSYGFKAVNRYVPLYFCSLILYAGILSGFAKGKLKRIGDVFLSTGGIVAGLIFLVCPLTSLPNYPLFHFISLQSFILHGLMLYIGLLMHITNYIKLSKKDIIYYSVLIVILGLIAYVFNNFTGGNLMFISQNFSGTFIEVIYKLTGIFFPIFMITVQATLPFYVVYFFKKKIENKRVDT